MGKYFGTDGIRGVVGERGAMNEALDARLAYRTGLAAGSILTSKRGGKKPHVIIAKDTRISGDLFECALSSGLSSAGADVTLLGVLPTPAVAYLTVKDGYDMGVVISASHNPYEHNGIKLFGYDGFKLSDATEELIENLIDGDVAMAQNHELGRVTHDFENRSAGEYVDYLAKSLSEHYGGRIAIDCANGAASATARELFTKIGVDFEIIADEPDGLNINLNCGSTYIGNLQKMVKAGRFDIGFAFDGDADRCLVVDENGEIVDGDMLLAVLARDMNAGRTLKNGAMVGTVISNSGMDAFAEQNGLTFCRAAVGDRNVLEKMQEIGSNLGGESSGHMIFLDEATTGDGQLTAVKLLGVLAKTGKTISELTRDIPRFPQVSLNFRLTDGAAQRERIMESAKLQEEIERQKAQLAKSGTVLIRPSGTEPLIRVLVEAKTEEIAREKAQYFIDMMASL